MSFFFISQQLLAAQNEAEKTKVAAAQARNYWAIFGKLKDQLWKKYENAKVLVSAYWKGTAQTTLYLDKNFPIKLPNKKLKQEVKEKIGQDITDDDIIFFFKDGETQEEYAIPLSVIAKQSDKKFIEIIPSKKRLRLKGSDSEKLIPQLRKLILEKKSNFSIEGLSYQEVMDDKKNGIIFYHPSSRMYELTGPEIIKNYRSLLMAGKPLFNLKPVEIVDLNLFYPNATDQENAEKIILKGKINKLDPFITLVAVDDGTKYELPFPMVKEAYDNWDGIETREGYFLAPNIEKKRGKIESLKEAHDNKTSSLENLSTRERREIPFIEKKFDIADENLSLPTDLQLDQNESLLNKNYQSNEPLVSIITVDKKEKYKVPFSEVVKLVVHPDEKIIFFKFRKRLSIDNDKDELDRNMKKLYNAYLQAIKGNVLFDKLTEDEKEDRAKKGFMRKNENGEFVYLPESENAYQFTKNKYVNFFITNKKKINPRKQK